MNLHEDINSFRVILNNISIRSGYRSDVIEKDYYVVLMLKELSEKQQNGLPAFFKGGSALYKALKSTQRFSEDIDLSVDTRMCSRTQNDKRLDQAAKIFNSLSRDISSGRTNRSEVISFFTYNPVTTYDANDSLQRFGKVKIEATSFTISEPYENLEIAPLVYELANEHEKKVLEDNYDVKPFMVKTITMERIFIDKLFAAEAYSRQSYDFNKSFDAAKHIYDLSVMSHQPKILSFLCNEEQLKSILDIRIEEELSRLDGIPDVMPYDFSFFNAVKEDDNIKDAYEKMQEKYVMNPRDRIDFDAAMNSLDQLHSYLRSNLSWSFYEPNERVELLIQKYEEKNDQSFEQQLPW